jgi:hypothetical protein
LVVDYPLPSPGLAIESGEGKGVALQGNAEGDYMIEAGFAKCQNRGI